MNTVELLEATKTRLKTVGWKQGGGIRSDGCGCLWIALDTCARKLNLDYETEDAAELLLARAIDPTFTQTREHVVLNGGAYFPLDVIAKWNDAPGRTVEDVLTLIDAVIDNTKENNNV